MPRNGQVPAAGCCQSLVFYNNSLLLYGYDIYSPYNPAINLEIQVYDLNSLSWRIANSTGTVQRPYLSGHSAHVFENFMYIINGYNVSLSENSGKNNL